MKVARGGVNICGSIDKVMFLKRGAVSKESLLSDCQLEPSHGPLGLDSLYNFTHTKNAITQFIDTFVHQTTLVAI